MIGTVWYIAWRTAVGVAVVAIFGLLVSSPAWLDAIGAWGGRS